MSLNTFYWAGLIQSRAPSGPPHSNLSKSLKMQTHIRNLPCLCVCVAPHRFPHDHLSVKYALLTSWFCPALYHRLSFLHRWLQHGACDTTMLALLCDSFLPLQSWEGNEMHKKTNPLKTEILLYSVELSGFTHHIYLEQANWFNLPWCLHHALFSGLSVL